MPTVTYTGVPSWQPEGPAPIRNIGREVATPGSGGIGNEGVGAIESVVVTPIGRVFVGTVNGGVWSSNDVTADQVGANLRKNNPPFQPPNFWVPLTDQQSSLAVSTMALEPNDPNNTLWVGTGSLSSASGFGGPALGILKTTNGGSTWSNLGSGTFTTPILSLVPTGLKDPGSGEVILVGTQGQGLWRSNTGGASFTPISFGLGVPSTDATVNSIVTDQQNHNVFYATVTVATTNFLGNTTNGSATVSNVSNISGSPGLFAGQAVSGAGIPAGTTILAISGTTVTLSAAATASNTGTVFSARSTLPSSVWQSFDRGATWNEIDSSIPQITQSPYLVLTATRNRDGNTNLYVVTTTQDSTVYGSHLTGALRAEFNSKAIVAPSWVSLGLPAIPNEAAGGSGHFFAVADPTNSNVIYVGGWQQDLFRVDATNPSNTSWTPLSLGSLGNPHDDQRAVAFLNDKTTLLNTNDGGIYALLNAQNPQGGDSDHWVSLNENIQDTEFFQVAYDSIDGTIAGGNQDNGTATQDAPESPGWTILGGPTVGGGDGGATTIDNSQSVPLFYLNSDGQFQRYSTANDALGYSGDQLPGLNGLAPADGTTLSKIFQTDTSVGIVVNPYSTTAPAPILFGAGNSNQNQTSLANLYESFNEADTLKQVSPATSTGAITAATYADALGDAYYGTSTGQLFLRNTYNGQFTTMPAPAWGASIGSLTYAGAFARQIVADPNAPQIVYVLDNTGQVWVTGFQGFTPWTNLSLKTNLPVGTVQTIQVFDPTPYARGNSVLLAGALGGVYRMNVNITVPFVATLQSWGVYGQALPNVQVTDLHYVPANPNNPDRGDLLLAGTYGRGAWEIPNASATLTTPGQVTIDLSNATILLRQDPANAANAQVLVDVAGVTVNRVILDNFVKMDLPWSAVPQINIQGSYDTVDILNLPQGSSLNVNLGVAGNAVNVGSATPANALGNIQGSVVVFGNGATKLTFFDAAGPFATPYTIDSFSLARPGMGTFVDFGVTSLTLHTCTAGTVQVNAGSSLPALTIDGSATLLVVNGSADPTTAIYTIKSSAVTVQDIQAPYYNTINFNGLGGLVLNTGLSENLVNVESTVVPTTIADPSDNGGVSVCPASKDLDGITSLLTVTGSGTTGLIVNDQARPSSGFAPHYTITERKLSEATYATLLGGKQVLLQNASIDFSGLGLVKLTLSTLANNLDIQGTPAPTTIQASARATVVNLTPGGQDLDYILGTVNLKGAGSSTLNIYDQQNLDAYLSGLPNIYAFNAKAFTRTAYVSNSPPQVLTVNYDNLAAINFWSAQVKNVIQVNGTPNGKTPLAIHAGSAGDQITVHAPVIAGSPVIGNVNVDGHGASVTVEDGGTQDNPTLLRGQFNSVIFTSTDQNVTFSDTVTSERPKSTATLAWTMKYSNLQLLSIDGGPVKTTVKVQSTASGTPVIIMAAGSFQVGKNDSVKYIRSAVTLIGESANSTLGIDDSFATAQDVVTVSNKPSRVQIGLGAMDSFFATGGGLEAANMSQLTLNLSNAAGDVVHLAPSVRTAYSVNGNLAQYKAGHGARLNLDLTGVSNAKLTGIPGTGVWSFGNRQSVTFSNMVMGSATPTVHVSDAGGAYDTLPFPATATVTGTSGTSGATLEGVGLTLDYQQLDSHGNVLADLGSTAPIHAGSYQVIASFAGSTDYTSASSPPAAFTISPATPNATPPADAVNITYGTPIVNSQLAGMVGAGGPATITVNGQLVTVDGRYSYSANINSVLNAGNGQIVPVAFVPSDSTDFNSVIGFGVIVNVAPATPTLKVSDASGTYNTLPFSATVTVAGVVAGVDDTPGPSLEGVGLTLDYQQLDANGNVLQDLGSAAPTTVGSYQVTASFAGSADYTRASNPPVAFIISPATPNATPPANAVNITYGTALVNSQLVGIGGSATITVNGQLVSVDGRYFYFGGVNSILNAGQNQVEPVYFQPNDPTDFNSVIGLGVIVNVAQAAPIIQVSDAGGPNNGQPYPATATVAGVVAGVDDMPGFSLEGVGLTLDYQKYVPTDGGIGLIDLGANAPSTPGNYLVIATFTGSIDYTIASAQVNFAIQGS